MAGTKKLMVRTGGFTSRFVHGIDGIPEVTSEGVELTKTQFQEVLNKAEGLDVTLVVDDDTQDDSGTEPGPEGS